MNLLLHLVVFHWYIPENLHGSPKSHPIEIRKLIFHPPTWCEFFSGVHSPSLTNGSKKEEIPGLESPTPPPEV